MILKTNLKLMLTNWSSSTECKCFRTYRPVIDHELTWCVWSRLNLELVTSYWISLKCVWIVRSHTTIICLKHILSLSSSLYLELTRCSRPVIYHELAWCSWSIFEGIHIWSSRPIINFKLWALHWSCITHLSNCTFIITTKINKLRFLQITFGISWFCTLAHEIIVCSTTHIRISIIHIIWIRVLFLYWLWVVLMTKASSIMCIWSFLRYMLLYTLMELTSIYCVHLYWI